MYKNYSHKRKTSLLLAFVMVLAIFAPILEHPVLAEGTYGTNAYKHIEHLSELEEPRVSGTESEVAISEYIKTQFESYGYKTKIQKFTFENRQNLSKYFVSPLATAISALIWLILLKDTFGAAVL